MSRHVYYQKEESEVPRLVLRILLFIGIPLIASLCAFLIFRSYFLLPADAENKTLMRVILTTDGFDEFSDKLVDRGIVKHASVLPWMVRIKKFPGNIKAGEYELSPSMTPTEILLVLYKGKRILRKVTLKNGESVFALGPRLELAQIATEKITNAALVSKELLKIADLNQESFEGFLYPGTYEFSITDKIQEIILTMYKRAKEIWKNEGLHQDLKKQKILLNYEEAITLASIVEREAQNKDDFVNLASVYLNRLRLSIRLQSDATVLYGLKDFSGALGEEQRKNNHPYNTHTSYGLPPGPICIPSDAAIRVVLQENPNKYLFYRKDVSGMHFSETKFLS